MMMIKTRTNFYLFIFKQTTCKHTANKPTDVCVPSGTAELDLTSDTTTEGG